MITIADKQECSGCGACYSVCPKKCISMKMDDEGFLYPHTNVEECIHCGLCERCCYFSSKENNFLVDMQLALAAQCKDKEILKKSSSGGIFSLLAYKIIEEGGVVFGAKWTKEWKVVHSYSETKEGIDAFRGSKYLQSEIGESFRQVRLFLKEGRRVLFSGTPCQIAGLVHYLRIVPDNLLCVEIACHGVPSPKIWQSYIQAYLDKHRIFNPEDISFRFKTHNTFLGNDSSYFSIFYKQGNSIRRKSEPFYSTEYGNAFSLNLISRPSCLNCKVKLNPSLADISLGDFQGMGHIYPTLTPKNGISLFICNSEKGLRLYNSIKESLFLNVIVSKSISIKHNSGLSFQEKSLKVRDSFMNKIVQTTSDKELINLLEIMNKSCIIKKIKPYLVRSRIVIVKNFFNYILEFIK